MGTHTLTKIGAVDNGSNFKVMRAILLLEKELHEAHTQVMACVEHGMHAFLSFFQEECKRIKGEIRSLLKVLCHNIDALCL